MKYIWIAAILFAVACNKPEPRKFPMLWPGHTIPPAGFYTVIEMDTTPVNHRWTLASVDGVVHELRFIGRYPDDIGFGVTQVKYVVARPEQGVVVLIDRDEKIFYRWTMHLYHK